MKRSRILPLALAASLAASLAACSSAPFDYRSQSEIPGGPGLFSGKEGAFVYRPGEAAKVSADPEAFEQWKRSAEGSAEYREFQEWREWREWKRRNAR